MNESEEYIVTDGGERLDAYLAQLTGQSRSQLQKRIKSGEITVGGRSVTPHYAVKAGDRLSITRNPVLAPDAPAPERASLPEIEIIDETDDYLVINKPAGVLMHQAPGTSELTIADWFVERFPAGAKIGEDPLRPGIVHRLDREASGLVVIAKTQAMFDLLKEQFKKRTIKKYYRALVYGADVPDEETITFKIERSSQGHRMAAKPVSQTGRSAITEFSVEHRYHNYALLRLMIKTGRTHQIRAHLSAYNHPIVGDDLYGGPKQRTANKKLKLGRVFLVAAELSFIDLAGNQKTYAVDLPPELEKILRIIK